MEASEKKINEILTENKIYEIPPYQRPYSWEKSHGFGACHRPKFVEILVIER